jgi:hypothetical protein
MMLQQLMDKCCFMVTASLLDALEFSKLSALTLCNFKDGSKYLQRTP